MNELFTDWGSGRVGRTLFAVAWLLLVSPVAVESQCKISGPVTADEGRSFQLCGPSGVGYTYEWFGPGVSINSTSRCVNVVGQDFGSYEYLLVVRDDGFEVGRCKHVINVGGSTGNTRSCTITGPTSIDAGQSAELCAPLSAIHAYEWTGPNGFKATTQCVTVRDEGTYTLRTRNALSGSVRTCTHRLDVQGASQVAGDCQISGPDVVASGSTVLLCGPSNTNVTYQWRGPGNLRSTTRCIRVSAIGSYSLTVRNRSTGQVDECTHRLYRPTDVPRDDRDDADEVLYDNCPKNAVFWARHCGQPVSQGLSREYTTAELRTLAGCIDQRSQYFSWSNDLDGLCRALNPARPMTQRKRLTREYAALLANVCAGETGLATETGVQVSLDTDTEVEESQRRTVAELMVAVERMLTTGRGGFASMHRVLQAINGGRGIGTVCE